MNLPYIKHTWNSRQEQLGTEDETIATRRLETEVQPADKQGILLATYPATLTGPASFGGDSPLGVLPLILA